MKQTATEKQSSKVILFFIHLIRVTTPPGHSLIFYGISDLIMADGKDDKITAQFKGLEIKEGM